MSIGASAADDAPLDVLDGIVGQHVDEAAYLRDLRTTWRSAAAMRLVDLQRLDERIAAHLDGIALAGAGGVRRVHQALARPGPGELFVAMVRAIEDRDAARIDKLLALAQAVPAGRRGVVSAFGWVPAASLRGITGELLVARDAWRRNVALAACGMHGVNPGPALAAALDDDDPTLRVRALCTAARCGRVDLIDACRAAIADPEPLCQGAAARAALLLGDRGVAIDALERSAGGVGSDANAGAALELVLRVTTRARAQELLTPLARDSARLRFAIRGVASTGDPHYVPWLIARMAEPVIARAAAEAFSVITGAELATLGLDIKPDDRATASPEGIDDVPEDDGLHWPAPGRIASWWRAQAERFVVGQRYFMGAPPGEASCRQVLATGLQRQRRAAAEHLALMAPGAPLFNIAAPAWRQRRLLAGSGR